MAQEVVLDLAPLKAADVGEAALPAATLTIYGANHFCYVNRRSAHTRDRRT